MADYADCVRKIGFHHECLGEISIRVELDAGNVEGEIHMESQYERAYHSSRQPNSKQSTANQQLRLGAGLIVWAISTLPIV